MCKPDLIQTCRRRQGRQKGRCGTLCAGRAGEEKTAEAVRTVRPGSGPDLSLLHMQHGGRAAPRAMAAARAGLSLTSVWTMVDDGVLPPEPMAPRSTGDPRPGA